MSYKDLIPGRSSSGLDPFRNPALAAHGEMQDKLNAVYRERAFVLALVARIAPMTHMTDGVFLRRDETSGWEDDWRWVIVVRLPQGEVAWHLHDSELPLFDRVVRLSPPAFAGDDYRFLLPDQQVIMGPIEGQRYEYDGHDTTEKYRRIYEYVTGEKE